jgi:hypothetical protein
MLKPGTTSSFTRAMLELKRWATSKRIDIGLLEIVVREQIPGAAEKAMFSIADEDRAGVPVTISKER